MAAPGRRGVKPVQRQHRIARLLETEAVTSQARLVELLAAEGVTATQATVSRDLEDLGALKVRLPGGETAWLRDAIYRRAAFEAVVASGRPPADWHRFVAHAYDVEEELHGGTAGVVDSAFYGRLFAYLEAARAPAEVRASIVFIHGLAAYDFVQAADAAAVLVSALKRNDHWIRPQLLHDGAVVSAIRLGVAPRAARLFGATARETGRSRSDLRSELLTSWIAAAAAGRGPKPDTVPMPRSPAAPAPGAPAPMPPLPISAGEATERTHTPYVGAPRGAAKERGPA